MEEEKSKDLRRPVENQEKNQEKDDHEDKDKEPAPGSPQAQQRKLHNINKLSFNIQIRRSKVKGPSRS